METTLDRALSRARDLCIDALACLSLLDRSNYQDWEQLGALIGDVQNELASAHVRTSARAFELSVDDDGLEAAFLHLDQLLRDAAIDNRAWVRKTEADSDSYFPTSEDGPDAYALTRELLNAVMVRRGIALEGTGV